MRWITSISSWLLKKFKRIGVLLMLNIIKNVDKNGDGRIEQGLWESPPPPIMKG